MKLFREHLSMLKNMFLEAKWTKSAALFTFFNRVIIQIFFITIYLLLSILFMFVSQYVVYFVGVAILLAMYFFLCNHKAFLLFAPLSHKIFFYFFGKYGKVVTKQDWANIKQKCPRDYHALRSKKCDGYCYYYSWCVAILVRNAKLMYCTVKGRDDENIAHAVVVKNNCVYDTSIRCHFDLEEYITYFKVNVYTMFSEEEYKTKTFFDDIREGWVKWCVERGVYCNPE